jgi:hypothetical protein
MGFANRTLLAGGDLWTDDYVVRSIGIMVHPPIFDHSTSMSIHPTIHIRDKPNFVQLSFIE